MIRTGVIIGRFQYAEMPSAVIDLIASVSEKHERIIVALGETPLPGTAVNPLSVDARKAMIRLVFPQTEILSLKDHPLDNEWSGNLDKLLMPFDEGTGLILYGDRDRFVRRYSGKFPVRVLSGNDGTGSVPEEKPESPDFRKGVVFSCASAYPRAYRTVDVAVFRTGREEVLLGRKTLDKKWRLIGGFTDPDDASFEDAARRELREECGDITTSPMRYEGSFKIDDWRYRYEKDKIITTLFACDFVSGTLRAADDIAELEWFSLAGIASMAREHFTAQEHTPLFTHLLKKYGNDREFRF